MTIADPQAVFLLNEEGELGVYITPPDGVAGADQFRVNVAADEGSGTVKDFVIGEDKVTIFDRGDKLTFDDIFLLKPERQTVEVRLFRFCFLNETMQSSC